jgi:hypothetical protein
MLLRSSEHVSPFFTNGLAAVVEQLPRAELPRGDRVISILREAIEIAERTDDERRTGARVEIGQLLRRLALEAEFDNYGADEIDAWKRKRDAACPRDPDREAQFNELQKCEADSKRQLLAGDLASAQDTYMSAEELRKSANRWGLVGAYSYFLVWKLEAGDLSGALSLFQTVDWDHPWTRVGHARRIASAFIAAEQRPQGLQILRELRPARDAVDGYKTLSYLGQALWVIGEAQEGKALLREAAAASLRAVAQNAQLPLWGYSSSEPIAIARVQCEILDQEGAVETMHGVLKLTPSIEYDPPPQRPAHLPPDAIYIAGPSLKPAAKRWLDARPYLVRMLARVGLDAEAFSLSATPKANQLGLLSDIIHGQAERGAFTAAFRSLERLEKDALTAEAEPTSFIFKPSGEVSIYAPSSPVRPVEELERRAAFKRSLWSILQNAAKFGDIDPFKRADRLWRERITEDYSRSPIRNFADELRMLAKAGQIDPAMEFARALPDFGERILALLKVVEGVAGLPGPLDGPFLP